MKKWKKVLVLTLIASMLSGCAMQELVQVTKEENSTEEMELEEEEISSDEKKSIINTPAK